MGSSGQLGFNKNEIVEIDYANNKIVHPMQDKVKFFDQIDFKRINDLSKDEMVDIRNPEGFVPLLLRP